MSNRLVKIRLDRVGHKHYIFFKLVAIYKSKRNGGPALDLLGFYNVHESERKFFCNLNKLGVWLNKGAHINSNFIHKLSQFCE